MQNAAVEERREPGPDRLRGLVIVLMALDHARMFFHVDVLRFSPTDLTQTYPALFLTRFVTHYCAPTFALLAGLGAFLHYAKGHDQARTAKFLLTRGLWLVFLDVALISPIFTQEIGKFALGTLWAIGCGLIALSALCFLGSRAALAIGCVLLACHDLLDGVHSASLGFFGPFLEFFARTRFPAFRDRGPRRLSDPALDRRRRAGLWVRSSLSRRRREAEADSDDGGPSGALSFILLRGINHYGDPKPWSVQPTLAMTALSFLNVSPNTRLRCSMRS